MRHLSKAGAEPERGDPDSPIGTPPGMRGDRVRFPFATGAGRSGDTRGLAGPGSEVHRQGRPAGRVPECAHLVYRAVEAFEGERRT